MFGLIAKKDKAMQKGYQSYNILKAFIERDKDLNVVYSTFFTSFADYY